MPLMPLYQAIQKNLLMEKPISILMNPAGWHQILGFLGLVCGENTGLMFSFKEKWVITIGDLVFSMSNCSPGGLKSYLQRARSLLKDAQAGVNPFAGLTPQVPDGAKLSGSSGPGSEAFAEMERLGMQQLLGCSLIHGYLFFLLNMDSSHLCIVSVMFDPLSLPFSIRLVHL